MRKSVSLLFLITLNFCASSQIESRRLFFEFSGSPLLQSFVPKQKTDNRLNIVLNNNTSIGVLQVGLGLQYPSNFTTVFKASFTVMEFQNQDFYSELSEFYTDSYFYTNSSNKEEATNFESTIGLEAGYLMKLNGFKLKPNFKIGLLMGRVPENIYGYRMKTENLITVINLTPKVLPSLYLSPSLDFSFRKWKKSFLFVGYGYSPFRIRLSTTETFPNDDIVLESNKLKFAYHQLMVGYKMAFLK